MWEKLRTWVRAEIAVAIARYHAQTHGGGVVQDEAIARHDAAATIAHDDLSGKAEKDAADAERAAEAQAEADRVAAAAAAASGQSGAEGDPPPAKGTVESGAKAD